MEITIAIITALMLVAIIATTISNKRTKERLAGFQKAYEGLTSQYSSALEEKALLSKERDDILKRLYNQEAEITQRFNEKFEAWKVSNEASIRSDAVSRSRSVIRGQATEHLAPLTMPSVNIKDFRFIGNPIDYLVFCGASDITDKQNDQIEKVILLEIKSGKSKLNKVQRRIRDAVKEGRVEFAIYNPDTGLTKTTTIEE